MILGVTVGSRYAEALLLRGKTRNVAILAVEGSTDSRAYRKLLDGSVHIMWLNGKDEVLQLLDRFGQTRIPGTAGLIDADYDRLFGKAKQNARVCWTSHTDLESMILSSEAYIRATNNGLDEESRREHRRLLLAAAAPLGYLRAISARSRFALDFKALKFSAFIDSARITCDEQACCEEVKRANLQSDLTVRDLLGEIAEMRQQCSDPWLIVNGHDLCRIARICSLRLFRRTFDTPGALFEALAVNYGLADFKTSSTYQELLSWEQQNPGFSVFAAREITQA